MKTGEASTRRIIAGSVGNTLEWYDFAVYGFFAPVIGRQFFPSDDPHVSLISAFGVFAAGFLMRPLGSVFLGHVADKAGRRKALILSVALMAIPTTLIGVLPTYESIGIAAPIALTLLRLLQGLSVGGEYTGSSVYLYEIAPKNRRAFVVSWALVGVALGILMGSGVATLATSLLPDDDLATWGWRIPFLFGLVVGITGFTIRRRNTAYASDRPLSPYGPTDIPVVEIFRHHRTALLRTIACNTLNGVSFYMVFVYLTTYLQTYSGLSEPDALGMNTLTMVLYMALLPPIAFLADKTSRKSVMLFGTGLTALAGLPLFWLLSHDNLTLVMIGQFGLTVALAFFFAPLMATMIAQFPSSVRVTGYSIGYNIPLAIFGGTSPLVATFLIDKTHLQLSPALYLIAAAILAFVVIWRMPHTENAPD
ncbi:MAG: MFS transporter [Pseudomonadota bacterium]